MDNCSFKYYLIGLSEQMLNVSPHIILTSINTIVFQILGPTNKSTSSQEQMFCTSFQIHPNLR